MYDGLTRAEELDAWFTTGAEVDARPGGTMRWRWKNLRSSSMRSRVIRVARCRCRTGARDHHRNERGYLEPGQMLTERGEADDRPDRGIDAVDDGDDARLQSA